MPEPTHSRARAEHSYPIVRFFNGRRCTRSGRPRSLPSAIPALAATARAFATWPLGIRACANHAACGSATSCACHASLRGYCRPSPGSSLAFSLAQERRRCHRLCLQRLPAMDGASTLVWVRVPRACAGSGSSLALCLPLTPLLVDEVVVDVWERGSHELPSQHGGISERATTASGCCRGSAAPAEHIW